MYYEINVSKQNDSGDYIHYFVTHKRSISNKARLKVIVEDFLTRFPKPEFNISVSLHEEKGICMDADGFIANPEILTM
jgi:hypothetical protein